MTAPRRRRLALALAAVSVVAVPSVATASDGVDELVVTGSRSAYVDFEITRRTVLRGPKVDVMGGRSLVAVLISPIGDRQPVTSIGMMRSPQLSPRPVFLGVPELQPGRYRARLVTDAPTRVAFSVAEGDGRVLRPRVKLPASTRTDRRQLAAGRSVTDLRLTGAVPAGRLSLLGHVVTGQRVEQTSACVVEAGRRCPGLPLRPPAAVPDADPGVRVPTTHDTAIAAANPPAPVRLDALVAVDGYRTTAGELRTVLVTFPA